MIVNFYIVMVFSGLLLACQTSTNIDDREVAQPLTKERDKLVKNLEHLCHSIDQKINAINDRINISSGESAKRYGDVSLRLMNEREKVETLIDDVKHAGQRSWQDVKDGADYVSIEVKRAIQKIDKEIEEIS